MEAFHMKRLCYLDLHLCQLDGVPHQVFCGMEAWIHICPAVPDIIKELTEQVTNLDPADNAGVIHGAAADETHIAEGIRQK